MTVNIWIKFRTGMNSIPTQFIVGQVILLLIYLKHNQDVQLLNRHTCRKKIVHGFVAFAYTTFFLRWMWVGCCLKYLWTMAGSCICVIWFLEQVWVAGCAGWVRYISAECTLAFRSFRDPNKAAGLGGHALILPVETQKKRRNNNQICNSNIILMSKNIQNV